MNPKVIFNLLKDSFKDWSDDKASRLGASLSYYTLFSLGPLLVIVVSIVSIFYVNARQDVINTIGSIVGSGAQQMIVQTMDNANKTGTNIVATIIGVVTLLLGAAGVFGQLKDSLNTIWEVEPKPGAGILVTLKERFLSFTMVLGTGFLLLVSLVINAAIAAFNEWLKSILPGGDWIAMIVNLLVTVGVIGLVFALLFKYLPDVKIGWSDVWIGALFTSVLFVAGQLILAWYLQSGLVGESFGAVSSVIIVLVWVYYSAQIFFFGAEFTQVYTNKYGSRVVPDENAQFTTEEARAQQGISDTKADNKKERQDRRRTPRVSGRLASPWFKS
jgi:membrane protein